MGSLGQKKKLLRHDTHIRRRSLGVGKCSVETLSGLAGAKRLRRPEHRIGRTSARFRDVLPAPLISMYQAGLPAQSGFCPTGSQVPSDLRPATSHIEASPRRLATVTTPPRTTRQTTITAAPADHACQRQAKCRRPGSADPRVPPRTQFLSDSMQALLELGSPLVLFWGRLRKPTRRKQWGAHQLGKP
jgi:hypothetical protein